ncbi:MAG: tail fiber protein [Nitrososphaerales archaeon]
MPTNYPNNLDTTVQLPNNRANNTVNALVHAAHHNNISDAIIAIETELGTNPRGNYSNVRTRLEDGVLYSPSAAQVIRPTANVVALILRNSSAQLNNPLLSLQTAQGAQIASWDRFGAVDAAGYKLNGADLASTHLADSADLIRNPSPNIISPTLADATLTGTPTAPTPATADNSTKIATTAYVKNQGYAPLNSPAFTGTTSAPTPLVNNNSTRIATTAYVQAEIADRMTVNIPVGTIVAYGGSTAPSGWLLCDGSAVSRTTYSALFDVIGTTYGSGDGSTTFNLPDLRGRIPYGKGTHADVDNLGDSDGVGVASRRPRHGHTFSLSAGGGGHSHTLSIASAGGHTHTIDGAGSTSAVASGSEVTLATGGTVSTSTDGSHNHGGSGTTSSQSHSHTIASATIGLSGVPEGPAYLVINYIIKV